MQKYFRDPISGLDYSCSECFNYVAVDECGSLFLYEKSPQARIESGYFSGGLGSTDLCVVQRDIDYREWQKTVVKLTI